MSLALMGQLFGDVCSPNRKDDTRLSRLADNFFRLVPLRANSDVRCEMTVLVAVYSRAPNAVYQTLEEYGAHSQHGLIVLYALRAKYYYTKDILLLKRNLLSRPAKRAKKRNAETLGDIVQESKEPAEVEIEKSGGKQTWIPLNREERKVKQNERQEQLRREARAVHGIGSLRAESVDPQWTDEAERMMTEEERYKGTPAEHAIPAPSWMREWMTEESREEEATKPTHSKAVKFVEISEFFQEAFSSGSPWGGQLLTHGLGPALILCPPCSPRPAFLRFLGETSHGGSKLITRAYVIKLMAQALGRLKQLRESFALLEKFANKPSPGDTKSWGSVSQFRRRLAQAREDYRKAPVTLLETIHMLRNAMAGVMTRREAVSASLVASQDPTTYVLWPYLLSITASDLGGGTRQNEDDVILKELAVVMEEYAKELCTSVIPGSSKGKSKGKEKQEKVEEKREGSGNNEEDQGKSTTTATQIYCTLSACLQAKAHLVPEFFAKFAMLRHAETSISMLLPSEFHRMTDNLPQKWEHEIITAVDGLIYNLREHVVVPEEQKAELRREDQALLSAMNHLGLHVQLTPDQVLFIARTGSYMYGLANETSDEDYTVIFKNKPAECVGVLKPPVSYLDQHSTAKGDKSGVVEFSASEIAKFLEEMGKGNPKNVELIFTPQIIYASREWQNFAKEGTRLLSKRVICQYQGFVWERLSQLHKKGIRKYSIGKLLYHAYHKLFDLCRLAGVPILIPLIASSTPKNNSVEYTLGCMYPNLLVEPTFPQVFARPEEREFILALRKIPDEEYEREAHASVSLLSAHSSHIKAYLAAVDVALCVRDIVALTTQDPWISMEADSSFLSAWLCSVRGLGS